MEERNTTIYFKIQFYLLKNFQERIMYEVILYKTIAQGQYIYVSNWK